MPLKGGKPHQNLTPFRFTGKFENLLAHVKKQYNLVQNIVAWLYKSRVWSIVSLTCRFASILWNLFQDIYFPKKFYKLLVTASNNLIFLIFLWTP